jgi:hypothetical protein
MIRVHQLYLWSFCWFHFETNTIFNTETNKSKNFKTNQNASNFKIKIFFNKIDYVWTVKKKNKKKYLPKFLVGKYYSGSFTQNIYLPVGYLPTAHQ